MTTNGFRERLLNDAPDLMALALVQPDQAYAPLEKLLRGYGAGKEVLDSILGLGPLQNLYKHPSVTDILVNRYDDVYAVIDGILYKTDLSFPDPAALEWLAQRIVGAAGRVLTAERPMALVHLKDGSRARILRPPLVPAGTALAIRKPATDAKPLAVNDLVRRRAWSPALRDFLRWAVRDARLSILFYGEMGSGKTTNLRAAAGFIPRSTGRPIATPRGPLEGITFRRGGVRVLTLEHTLELGLHRQHDHVLAVEAVERADGEKAIPLHRVFPVTLQLLPTWIIIGEVLGEEAMPMLKAAISGHPIMATIHAGSPEMVVWRLVFEVLAGGTSLTEKMVREMVYHAIPLMVEQHFRADGTRGVTRVTELLPTGEARTLFAWRDGALQYVQGPSDFLLQRLAERGAPSPPDPGQVAVAEVAAAADTVATEEAPGGAVEAGRKPTPKLGEVLVRAGVINEVQLRHALTEQQTSGVRLGEALVRLGFVTETDVARTLADQLGIQFLAGSEIQMDTEAARLLPEPLARQYDAIPIGEDGGGLVVAVLDPLHVFALDSIANTTGCGVRPVIVTRAALEDAMRRAYGDGGAAGGSA